MHRILGFMTTIILIGVVGLFLVPSVVRRGRVLLSEDVGRLWVR